MLKKFLNFKNIKLIGVTLVNMNIKMHEWISMLQDLYSAPCMKGEGDPNIRLQEMKTKKILKTFK